MKDKIKAVATKIYGADDVTYNPAAEKMLAKIEEMGTHRENNRKNFAVTETGEPVVYDLVLSSSKFGIEGSAEIIKQSVSRI